MWLTPKFPQLAVAANRHPVEGAPIPITTPTTTPTMVLKIRLARFGRTNAPFYNIVVAHARYLFPAPLPRPPLPRPPLTTKPAS